LACAVEHSHDRRRRQNLRSIISALEPCCNCHIADRYFTPLLVNAGFTVVVADLRGFGQSAKVPHTYKHTLTPEQTGADTCVLIRALKLRPKRVILLGCSMAAASCTYAAAQLPDEVAACVFFGPFAWEHPVRVASPPMARYPVSHSSTASTQPALALYCKDDVQLPFYLRWFLSAAMNSFTGPSMWAECVIPTVTVAITISIDCNIVLWHSHLQLCAQLVSETSNAGIRSSCTGLPT
jgi:pimeloyl-ACP methyl ester carboxylesterase